MVEADILFFTQRGVNKTNNTVANEWIRKTELTKEPDDDKIDGNQT